MINGMLPMIFCLLAKTDPAKGLGLDKSGFWLTFWTTATFLVVLIILWKFAWKPILVALEERSEGIRSDIEGAESSRVEAQKLKAEYRGKIEGARDQVTELIEEGRRDAAKVRDDMVAEAQKEATAIRERAQRESELSKAQALETIWDTAADLSTELAGKIIEKSLNADDHKKLVDDVVSRYKAMSAGGA